MSKQLWITLCTLYISKHIHPGLPRALFCNLAHRKWASWHAEAQGLGRAAAVPWALWRKPFPGATRDVLCGQDPGWAWHGKLRPSLRKSPMTFSFIPRADRHFFFFFGDMLEGFPWQPDWSLCICPSLRDAHLDGGGWSSKFRTQSPFGL